MDVTLLRAKFSSDDDPREKGCGKDAQTFNSPIHVHDSEDSFGRLQTDRRPTSAEMAQFVC